MKGKTFLYTVAALVIAVLIADLLKPTLGSLLTPNA